MQKVKKKHSLLKRAVIMFLSVLFLITSFLSFGSLSVFASDGDILDVDVSVKQLYEQGVGTNDFGLYVLVDNPKGTELDLSEERNKIQIGYSVYEKDVFSADYNKYELEYKQETDSGYLLFEVLNFPAPKTLVRYYAVSGIELVTVGDTNATEYGVSKIYKCETKDNVNTITVDSLNSIEVDVNHTFYRSNYSGKNAHHWLSGWGNQLSSCYFSLPNNYFGSMPFGGQLDSVTAEFYNYVTKPILITNSQAVYNEYAKILHKKCTDINYAFAGSYDAKVGGMFDGEYIASNSFFYQFSFVPSAYPSEFLLPCYHYDSFDVLDWLFLDHSADFTSEDYIFSGEKLKNYYSSYSNLNSSDKAIEDLFINEDAYVNGTYSLAGFDYGYNKHTYSIADNPEEGDDVFGFNFSYYEPHAWSWLVGDNLRVETKSPLVKVLPEHVDSLTDERFSEYYLVDKSDVSDLKQYVKVQNFLGKSVFLLRYDFCEYFGHLVEAQKIGNIISEDVSNSMFLAQESVYLDFDVLSFGFNQDGERYTIANVMSPEDHFPDPTPTPLPETGCAFLGWIKSVLGIIVFVISVVVAGIIVFFIFKFIFAVCATQWKTWVKVFWIIFVLLVIGAVLFFAVPWVINLITSLRG